MTGDKRVRGLTVFIFNVYNMRVLKGGRRVTARLCNIYKYRGITAYIYTDCYCCSGVVAGVKRFRVIALRFYVCELPSFCRHPRRSSPPPPVHGRVYSGGGSKRVGSVGGENGKPSRLECFAGIMFSFGLCHSTRVVRGSHRHHPCTQNAQTTLVICANSPSFNSYGGGKTPPGLYK